MTDFIRRRLVITLDVPWYKSDAEVIKEIIGRIQAPSDYGGHVVTALRKIKIVRFNYFIAAKLRSMQPYLFNAWTKQNIIDNLTYVYNPKKDK